MWGNFLEKKQEKNFSLKSYCQRRKVVKKKFGNGIFGPCGLTIFFGFGGDFLGSTTARTISIVQQQQQKQKTRIR